MLQPRKRKVYALPHYKLYNKENDRDLVHPKVGLWNTTDIEEAKGMCESFKLYLGTLGLEKMASNIVVKEIDTDQEI